MVKNITLDENAHSILIEAKKDMRKRGINHPSLSDAVRWLNERNSMEEQNED